MGVASQNGKTKESARRGAKTQIRIVSRVGMTAAEQSSFDKPINVLLAELVRSLDRREEGAEHGITEG